MRNGPLDRGPGIVIGDGERVFRGSSVINRENDNFGFGSEGVEVVVVRGRGGGFDAETTAMEVYEEGEVFVSWVCGFGYVDSSI